jgi:hypothetical protein
VLTRDKEDVWTYLGWGLDMFSHNLWNPDKEPNVSGMKVDFDGKIYFDILHFTNSPNAPP